MVTTDPSSYQQTNKHYGWWRLASTTRVSLRWVHFLPTGASPYVEGGRRFLWGKFCNDSAQNTHIWQDSLFGKLLGLTTDCSLFSAKWYEEDWLITYSCELTSQPAGPTAEARQPVRWCGCRSGGGLLVRLTGRVATREEVEGGEMAD